MASGTSLTGRLGGPDGGDRPQVLIVEDSVVHARYTELILTAGDVCAFDVTSAHRLSDALQRLAKGGIDVVLLDLNLPDSEGLQTFQAVQSAAPCVPVVVLTQLDHEKTAIEALRRGAQDYLLKGGLGNQWLMQSLRYAIERKRFLERAKAHQETEQLVASIPNVLIGVDETGCVTRWNSAAETHFGISAAQTVGQPFLKCPIQWHDQDAAARIAACRNGSQPLRIDNLGFNKQGEDRFLNVTVTAVTTEDGTDSGFLVLGTDVTEKKQLQDQLQQSQKLEAVGSLAGGVAHEFNNLLQAILGYTNFALEGLPDRDKRAEDLQQVLKAADRAAILTRQLLSFGRRQTLAPEVLQPSEIVNDLQKLLRPLIGEHIELEFSSERDAGTIHADPTLIQQMLLNLCINARDAMPGGGQLTIRIQDVVLDEAFCSTHGNTQPGRHLLIRVSDTGCGMPAEVKQRIFEPFFTTKPTGQGTGLGLAMVYGVVQQHQGTLNVTSEPERGTTFDIFLPVTQIAPAAVQPAVSQSAPGGTETLLIADDEPVVRDLAARILTQAGYHVLTAADGEEVVHLFRQQPDSISLVLLDMVMPKISGREAYQRIKQINPATPVLFCTGYAFDGSQDGALADEPWTLLVQKPFRARNLLDTVRKALDQAPANSNGCLSESSPT